MEILKLLARLANPKNIFKFSNATNREHPDLEDGFREGRLKGMILCMYIAAFSCAIVGILQIAIYINNF